MTLLKGTGPNFQIIKLKIYFTTFEQMNLKHELQSIISGAGTNSKGSLIQTAAHYLRESKEAGRNSQKVQFSKDQETEKLIQWVQQNNLWYNNIDETRFLARGAEQRVYLLEDVRFVLKLNDSIFYAYWLDYFYSLLIHNFLFPQTAYELIGFYLEKEHLHAVVKQPFVEITEPTNLEAAKEFLLENGFQHKRNDDYFNPHLGIILEDLHDENILSNQKTLFFIDTVFYLMSSFFSKHSI